MPTKTSPSALPHTTKATYVATPSRKPFPWSRIKGGLKAESVPAFGLPTHIIDVRALAIAHNVKETIGIESTQTDKPAPPARPKKSRADPPQHPRRQPHPHGTALLTHSRTRSADSNPYCRL